MSDDTYDVEMSPDAMPLDDDSDLAKGSVLDQLKEELAKEVERSLIEIRVPERPNISIRFSPNMTQEQIKAWQRNSGSNSKRGMDGVKFACYVIGSTTSGIYVNDNLVTNNDGIAVNFASKELEDMTEMDNPFDVIKVVFGVEAHIESTAMAIVEAAGWGEDVDVEDPTARR